MLFSIKMRAAEGATHEAGGKHISGAERLVNTDEISTIVQELLDRARNHERGNADFINIKISAVQQENIITAPVLNIVQTETFPTPHLACQYAHQILLKSNIPPHIADLAFEHLNTLKSAMRGAALLSLKTAKFIDLNNNQRGVRVSNMDAQCKLLYHSYLNQNKLYGDHPAEAILLASKVASAPFIAAEICWSDDPSYTTGYVTDKQSYYRINNFKPLGNDVGGRVFIVDDTTDSFCLDTLLNYLQKQVILITTK